MTSFDYLIGTPPCNYYSRANYRRDQSLVALSTKAILPMMLEKFINEGKPFLIENVLNSSLLPSYNGFMLKFGQHIFYTNVLLLVDESFSIRQNKQNVCRDKRDNNYNVDYIIRLFLETISASS